ncbi:hypothetical protein WJX72_005077 [[Myrmecia] bisecta]|uniref:Spatacsin C-terminal domain-containing protein n=1 Tax=[Myrmecia] bisecta TaxID=41462 RepID=A0AAW1R694_9CHLO
MDRVAADDARWAGTAAIRQRLLHSQQELASTSAAELGSHELPFARLQSAASKPDLQAEAYRLLRLARIDEAAAYVSAADQSGAPETQQASQHAPVLPPLKWLQSLTPVELLCCLLDAPNAVMPASPAVLEHWPAVLGYCCRHHKAQEMMELLRSLPASTACAHYLVQRPANSTLLFSALYAETAAQHPSFLQAVQTVDGALLRLLARARQLMRQLAAPLTLSSADSSSSTPSTSALQAVFVQHARQQQLPFLLHHFLAGVVRESPWHSLEPWLQELVAGLFDSEQTRHMQHAYIQHALPGFQKDSSAPDRSLFSTYEGDITLMQLLEGVWPARLRPLLSLFCLADTNAAPFKVNAGTPDTQADMLAQAQQAVTGHQAPNTASLRLQHLVHKGRPLAALHTLLSGTPEAAGQPGRPDADEMLPWREEGAMQQLPASALHSLKALMNPSSLAHPLHKMDLATRVALLAMCGQPSWPLRVHSMAAQLHATSPHLQPPLNSLSPIPQAPLTTAELAAPGAVSPVTRGPGYAQSREILRLSAWHGGSLQQGSLLTYLAQTGDWMRFLAEAGSPLYPVEQVRSTVDAYLLQSWAGGDVAAAERQLEGLQASAAHAQRTGAGGVPAHWSSQALWTAMDAVLQSPATPAEMQLLLGLLTRLDLGAPFGSGMARYRTLAEACQLLGQNAWEFVRWPAVGQRQAPLVDTDAVLAHLMERQDWPGARRWADGVIQVLHEVTRTEGKALVREWRLRAWQPELRPHCWDELARLFTEQGFPPACAARFLVAQADALLQADAITPREQYELLQEALAWLAGERGMKYDCPPGVLSALRSCLQLLAVNAASPAGPASVIRVRSDRRRSSSGSADQVEASMYPGQPQYADPFRQSSAGRRRESDGLSSSIAGEPDAQVAGLEAAALKQMHAILRLIHSRVTRQQLQQAVGQTLELGDVAAARQLSLGLASPPIELALVEAATACLADGSARNIPQAVLDFLRNKSGGLLRMDDPQEVLNALSAACRAGAGQSVCSRAAATFRAAGLLGLSPGEAGAMSSISILQWLLMKGPGHLQAAMDFAKAHALEPADLAQCLARAFLKGLMSQNDQAAGGAPAWTLEAVVACSKELAGDADLAGTLLRLLLDLHSGLEGSVEAELLVAAHHCYEASNSLECIDVLLELASAGVAAYQATQDFPALARIAAGLGGYQQLRGVIDYLLQHGQLDLLLQQLGPGGVALGATGRQMLRTAILAAIQRRQQQEQQQQPDEQAQHAQRSSQAGKAGKSQAEEPAVIVHRHFKMARESAADLGHSAAQMLRQAGEMGSEVTANLMRLEAMRAALEASAAYEAAEGPLAARRWASTAALTALQVQDPLTNWAALAAQARQDVRTPMPLDAIVLAYAWQPAAGTPAGR